MTPRVFEANCFSEKKLPRQPGLPYLPRPRRADNSPAGDVFAILLNGRLNISGVSKTRTRGRGLLFYNFFFLSLFFDVFFLCFFFFTQILISRDLNQQCIIAIFSHVGRVRCGGAHFFTPSQTIRVKFQSRQSHIEAAQIYFLVQRADFCKKVHELVELVEN